MKGKVTTSKTFGNVTVTDIVTEYPKDGLTRTVRMVKAKTPHRTLMLERVRVTDASGNTTMKYDRQQIGGQKVKFYLADLLTWLKIGYRMGNITED